MDDSLKQKIVDSLKKQLPEANEERLKVVLELILLEVESYNTCGNNIPWEKLQGAITEVLYQSTKNELKTEVSSVKRGDTTISYTSKSNEIKGLLAGYDDLFKRIIGCGGLEFF